MSEYKYYETLKQFTKDAKKSAAPWKLYEIIRDSGAYSIDNINTFSCNIDAVHRLEWADVMIAKENRPILVAGLDVSYPPVVQYEHYKILKKYTKDAKKTAKPWELYGIVESRIMRDIHSHEGLMSHIARVVRRVNADALLTPPNGEITVNGKITVDMAVLNQIGILCKFHDGLRGEYTFGYLDKIDPTDDTPYTSVHCSWVYCFPTRQWNSDEDFDHVSQTIQALDEAGFVVESKVYYQRTIAFRITGTKPTHRLPWETE
jgi:hypothetical protein